MAAELCVQILYYKAILISHETVFCQINEMKLIGRQAILPNLCNYHVPSMWSVNVSVSVCTDVCACVCVCVCVHVCLFIGFSA